MMMVSPACAAATAPCSVMKYSVFSPRMIFATAGSHAERSFILFASITTTSFGSKTGSLLHPTMAFQPLNTEFSFVSAGVPTLPSIVTLSPGK